MLRQEHKAGEKLFVDWAGTTIPIYDPRGGPVQQAHLFVAALGASSYTYTEATADEQLASWSGAHVRAFEFYRGVPKLVAYDFVPGHKIRLLLPVALCALGRAE